MKRAATKALIVAGAAAALVGIGGGIAAAGTRSTASTEWAVDALHEYVKPSDSISIPTLSCGAGGYLKDADYSPGRIVPRGVEVVEPGGVGVTITHPTYGTMDPTGSWWPTTGTDGNRGWSYATNWDPFSGHDLAIKLHCTSDPDQAAKKTFVPGFPVP